MYITRMWFSENERQGFMTCSPAGYHLVSIAGLIGFLGWVLFLLLIAALILSAATRLFAFPTLWLFIVPLGFRFVAQFLDIYGRSLATRKHFEYHYKPDYSAWLDDNVVRTYPPDREKTVGAGESSAPPTT